MRQPGPPPADQRTDTFQTSRCLVGLLVTVAGLFLPSSSAPALPSFHLAEPACRESPAGWCTGAAWHSVNIFNADRHDPREAVDFSQELALRPIGRLDGSTAFLVSPCHALAAYHGVFGFKPPGEEPPVARLSLPLNSSGSPEPFSSLAAAPVIWGDGQDAPAVPEDWVLLRLSSCPGWQIGWMELMEPNDDSDLLEAPVSIAGYPNDRPSTVLWRDRTGSIKGHDPSPLCGCFLNSAATAGGNSGSPLYREGAGRPIVVGVQVRVRGYTGQVLTAYDNEHANIAIDVRPIHQRIRDIIQADKDAFWRENPNFRAANPAHAR